MRGSFQGFLESSSPSFSGAWHTGAPTISNLEMCDIGFNATDEMFSGMYNGKQVHHGDLKLVLLRASSLGVKSALCTSGTIREALDTIHLCREVNSEYIEENQNKNVILSSTVGIHPTRCTVFADAGMENILQELRNIVVDGMKDNTVVAIGECGLDYDRLQFCNKDLQVMGFIAQLHLAHEFNLPIFFHERNSGGDFLKIIVEYSNLIVAGGVVHSFTGTIDEMQAYTERGLYIGINGCSLKTQDNLEVVKAIPEHLLLIETDAPWCNIKATHASNCFVSTKIPSVKKEKFVPGLIVKDRNEPCHLVQILEVVAAIRHCDVMQLARIIHDNTLRLFPTIFNCK